MGCTFQRGGTCVRAFVGKSASWLCASPKSASSGSPVSDRQTQRQAQAGGGGRRRARARGESGEGRLQGQGRRKKWNPIPGKKRRRREQISYSRIQISLSSQFSGLFIFLPFSVSPFSPPASSRSSSFSPSSFTPSFTHTWLLMNLFHGGCFSSDTKLSFYGEFSICGKIKCGLDRLLGRSNVKFTWNLQAIALMTYF